ncbi:NADH:flavin oxidoreductase/NADH oxidase [Spelaeicoccus albus]|uniref:2,4-dienoyl-CoA reductase-like NADH-dependent reductase (Old Yellow Enzyme family) n=1 Tax=Spelaeicoccus albus TaxID=1280376 RepID=A0A7Z0A844_9MICO|nr:NADH:flavin oxidoreductase/NADH oxidase [Spelaeicoccus albus]NYI66187.1 2,4-dienoyl-CoA reductase-like NADH-dependent reductase (Old Yellow Enzyme family) [Spelaeicoccus albus]
MSTLFEPYRLRGITFPNRIWLAPMCQYSSIDGLPNDWHLVHLGARVTGGFGLVLTEAAAVVPEGRISPQDAGIWNDEQADAWKRITDFAHEHGTPIGIQLAHAGRKASTYRPWDARTGSVPISDGGWQTLAPSSVPFDGFKEPAAMSPAEIADTIQAFVDAAQRADAAGFDVVELHAAHGYLLHQFLSPLSNERNDEYGGDFEGRIRLVVETASAVRAAWPDHKPLLVRISGTDWHEGGWTIEESTELGRRLKTVGVDLVDVSSGGNVKASIPVGPGYQVPLSAAVHDAIPTGAVGLITEPRQAEKVLDNGEADVVLLARAALREPAWPLRAAHDLGIASADAGWPRQYERGAWRD